MERDIPVVILTICLMCFLICLAVCVTCYNVMQLKIIESNTILLGNQNANTSQH